jgi:hypothetical protein
MTLTCCNRKPFVASSAEATSLEDGEDGMLLAVIGWGL